MSHRNLLKTAETQPLASLQFLAQVFLTCTKTEISISIVLIFDLSRFHLDLLPHTLHSLTYLLLTDFWQ